MNANLLESERKVHQLDALLKISQEITSTLDLGRVLTTVVNQAGTAVPFDRCAIGFFDRGRFLFPRRVYILNHPEYDTETLGVEYKRDSARDPSWPLPLHYFPGNDPAHTPHNTWRHTAHIYTNWVKALYEATPYNIQDIPRTF